MAEPSKPKYRTTFYLEPNLHKEFKTICCREDVKMTTKLEEFVGRYVAAHSEGNPQLRLDKFTGQISRTCFFCQGHFPSLKKVKFVSGLVAPVCDACLSQPTQQRCVKKVLGAV